MPPPTVVPTAYLVGGGGIPVAAEVLRPAFETGPLKSRSDAYLRQAMREAQRDLRLVPVFPPDLLGIVVLQPLLSP
jgi:hypothetical protein